MSQESQVSLRTKVGEIFGHPYMVAAAWIVGFISLALTIYFYRAGDHKPLLTYKPQPVNTVVVHAGRSSKLAVSFNGQQLVEDVTSAQVAFWNAGDLAIHGVLKPLRIYTEPRAWILEARLLRPTSDAIGLRLDESELAKGAVIVRWDLLEHNDGGVVQLIFTGKAESKVVAEAVIEGQRNINLAGSQSRTTFEKVVGGIALIAVCLVAAGIGVIAGDKVEDLASKSSVGLWHGSLKRLINIVVTFAITLALLGAVVWLIAPPSPPFEF